MGAMFVLFELLLALSYCRYVEPSVFTKQFSQNTVELLPCKERTATVSLYNSTLFTIMANLTYCPEMDTRIDTIGFRISTLNLEDSSGDADSSKSVVFTARQSSNNDGFVSWNAPLKGYNSMLFPNVSHTMCTVKNFTDDNMPLFYVDAFTSSLDSVTFTIEVELVHNFVLETNQTYTIEVGQATPQIYYYKIPSKVELVTIEANSNGQGCTIISIQDNMCPVNDLLKSVKSKGIYQTMISSSFLTINADSILNREFLLVLVTANRSLCYTDATSVPNKTVISIKISSMSPTREYIWPMMIPFVICIAIYIISMIVVCCFYAPRCEPKRIRINHTTPHRRCKCCVPIGSCRCILCYGPDPSDSNNLNNDAEESDTDDSNDHIEIDDTVINCKDGVWKYVCCKSPVEEVKLCISSPEPAARSDSSPPGPETPLLESSSARTPTGSTTYGSDGATNNATVEAGVNTGEGSVVVHGIAIPLQSCEQRSESNIEQNSNSNNVRNSNSTDREQKPYHVYSWNTVTVGIFYALPALQLVFSEQNTLDKSGDQDTCYYNFKCAHPAGPFTAFNNIWSNIGYIMLGGLFIIIVIFRHCQYIVRRSKNKQYVVSHGVPQFFGVYYAMGFGLILEGFMSSFYHICPSNANFQFDTAFMFITGGIILVKVYQNRHPNVQANAFIAFFAFAVIIFFTVIGIYNDKHHPFAIKVSFLFLALIVIIFFLAHFYPWNFSLRDNQDIFKEYTCSCGCHCRNCISGCCCGFWKLLVALCSWLCACNRWKKFCSAHRYRIVKHIIVLLCNVALGVGICVKYNKVGIAIAILTFFVVNIFVYLVIYCIIKLMYGEPWTWLNPLLLLLLIVAWGGAYHFYGSVTQWSFTPALSRTLNKPCIVEGFYDAHDVWHFLSACGMFFAFLFVLVIDDGVVNMKQETLLERAV